ncbi:MAG: DUF2949 domain-containing protein [Acaryochloridaceae cyanobacterium SU_2_1]|nr:DUF2949 domain-containing protein [Acaryochloridaceae cyanobacterium SU_2_1]NJM95245.1 DUF2949 domain-containing protein [Acaryochloridaceae cyanobacterium CSU_5_19]
MPLSFQQKFIQYLREDLALSPEMIDIALRRPDPLMSQLHIVLWQHGLISLAQLNSVFEWLEITASQSYADGSIA